MALTDTAHEKIRAHFNTHPLVDKNLAVDATCGNGYDTLFLAELGFEKVIGFDIQNLAIENTQRRISEAGIEGVMLHQIGHENMSRLIKQPVNCVIFNFGYLPSSDKSIRTLMKTSLKALKSALRLLSENGMMSLMCYPGHPQGLKETAGIQKWLATLDEPWLIHTFMSDSPSITTPTLYTIKKETQRTKSP